MYGWHLFCHGHEIYRHHYLPLVCIISGQVHAQRIHRKPCTHMLNERACQYAHGMQFVHMSMYQGLNLDNLQRQHICVGRSIATAVYKKYSFFFIKAEVFSPSVGFLRD